MFLSTVNEVLLLLRWEEVGSVAGVFVIRIRANMSGSLYLVTGDIVLSLQLQVRK